MQKKIKTGSFSLKVLIFTLLGMVVACGEDETDTVNQDNLIGTWVSKCAVDEGIYYSETYVFTETESTTTIENYGDDVTCSSLQQKSTYVAVYKSGVEAASSTSVDGATPIDLTFTKSEITVTSDEAAKVYNDTNLCNRTWVKDEAYEITVDCDDLKSLAAGATFYTIFQATGEKLFFGEQGEDDGGTTIEKRIASLDATGFIRK